MEITLRSHIVEVPNNVFKESRSGGISCIEITFPVDSGVENLAEFKALMSSINGLFEKYKEISKTFANEQPVKPEY